MPSTIFSSVLRVLLSSTVITPSLPTFSKPSAISLPISSSPALIDATWKISLELDTGMEISLKCSVATEIAFCMPFLRIIGFAPAV